MAIIIGGMVEAQQELIISHMYKGQALQSWRSMLFAGNAEGFWQENRYPDTALRVNTGLFKLTTRYMPSASTMSRWEVDLAKEPLLSLALVHGSSWGV